VGEAMLPASGAWIVFEDESGRTLRPPVVRTWAPVGQTTRIGVSGTGPAGFRSPGWSAGSPAAVAGYSTGSRAHCGAGERRSLVEADTPP